MIQTLHSLRFIFIMLIVFSHIIGKTFDFGGECGVSFFRPPFPFKIEKQTRFESALFIGLL